MSSEIQWDTDLPTVKEKQDSPTAPKKQADIQWDTSSAVPETPPSKTTFKGLTAAVAKGLPRGLLNLAEGAGRTAQVPLQGVPENMRLAPNPAAGAAFKRAQQAVQPSPTATPLEQMAGTGAEIGGSMLPFGGMGGVGLFGKAANYALPMAGGAVGEQLFGEPGKAIGSLAAPLAQLALTAKRLPIAARSDVTRELQQAGFKLTPDDIGAGAGFKTVETLAGSPQLAHLAATKNVPVAQNLAASEVGLPATGLTAKALDAASKAQHLQGYEPIRQLGVINNTITPKGATSYRKTLNTIADKYKAIEQSNLVAKRVNKLSTNQMKADDVLENVSQLRSDASDAFRSDKRSYGKALREIADTLENQIERNLPAGSKVLEGYRAARTQIAKNNAVKDMLVDPHTGIVSTSKAFKLEEDGAKLTGGLETLAKAGSKEYRRATDVPGTDIAANWWDRGAIIAGLASAPYTGGVGMLSLGIPPLRAAARHGLMADPVQRMMTQQAGGPSIFGAPANRIAGASLPLFSQGEQ